MDIKTLSSFSHVLHTKAGRPFLIDGLWKEDGKKKPILIFVHGFKGFKDWGPFPLLSAYFAASGVLCIKVNLSHNGTTPETPYDFSDLEAFGRNTFSQQLEDLTTVIDFVVQAQQPFPAEEADRSRITLLGHSRGGSLVLLQAAEDARVRKVITWAAVADLTAGYSDEQLADWKAHGVLYSFNGRTQQQMPQYYDYYVDLMDNPKRLNVGHAAEQLLQPLLLLHGDADETVPVSDADTLHSKAVHSELYILKGAGHTFGAKHPMTDINFPPAFLEALTETLRFIKNV